MALSVVVLVAFYFSIFQSRQRAVARLRKEASAVSRSVKEAAWKIASFPRLERKIEEYRRRAASIREKMGLCSTSRDVAEILVNEAKTLQLDVSISRNTQPARWARPGGETGDKKDQQGTEISFRARMPCSYRSLAEYVEAIEKAGAMIAVEEISLKRDDAAAKKLAGELIVTASLFPQ